MLKIYFLFLPFLFFVSCGKSHSTVDFSKKNNQDLNPGIDPEDPGVDPEPPVGDPKDPITHGQFDIYQDIAFPTGTLVDNFYSRYKEILKLRTASEEHQTDSCLPQETTMDNFGSRISYFVDRYLSDVKPRVDTVASYYALPTKIADHKPMNLISSTLCREDSVTLTHSLGAKRVPAASVIKNANTFIDKHNKLAKESKSGNRDSALKLTRLWSKFMYCLAYVESLPTADGANSKERANRLAPSDYRKPAGVAFYEDPLQPAASRINVGLYQFTPTASGNIKACLKHWNDLHPTCKTAETGSQAEMIRLLGSSFQSFNAFCGFDKVFQTFAVQQNTRSSTSTHKLNTLNGKIKEAGKRCVSPFFYAGKGYNHFGPLQNSTGSNMGTLLSCVANKIDQI